MTEQTAKTEGQVIPRVLVVDDEENIAALVRMVLEASNHEVREAHSGSEALKIVEEGPVDALVLDIMLGDMDGFELAEKLRRQGVKAPILFLTARDSVGDKVHGLELGDDYLTKPFHVDELKARVDALLRRSGGNDVHRLVVGDLELDEDNFRVTRAGTEISLTPTEFKMLKLLMRHAGTVIKREQILDAVWDDDFRGRASVDTYISYLRKKIDSDFDHQMLVTVRGFGYTLKPQP